jgi:hypothetical protein
MRNTSTDITSSQGERTLQHDSDDATGGTMESKDYSKPFEHILWRRLGLGDGSALSGSLPELDGISTADGDGEDEDDDDEGCTYLDPKELEEYCERLGNKELSDRIRTRLSTVLSGTYLSLSNVQAEETDLESSVEPSTAHKEPSGRSRGSFLAVNNLERFKKSRLVDSISFSGYSTDASSGFDNEIDGVEYLGGQPMNSRIDNSYSDLPTSLACSEIYVDQALSDGDGGEAGKEEYDGEQIYAEISDSNIETRIDDVPFPTTLKVQTIRHTPLHLSQSVPLDSNPRKNTPGGASQLTTQLCADRESPHYATLKEISNSLDRVESAGGFKRAPTLPPRRIKKAASLDPGRRKHHFRNEPVVPGVRTTN